MMINDVPDLCVVPAGVKPQHWPCHAAHHTQSVTATSQDYNWIKQFNSFSRDVLTPTFWGLLHFLVGKIIKYFVLCPTYKDMRWLNKIYGSLTITVLCPMYIVPIPTPLTLYTSDLIHTNDITSCPKNNQFIYFKPECTICSSKLRS